MYYIEKLQYTQKTIKNLQYTVKTIKNAQHFLKTKRYIIWKNLSALQK